MDGNSQKKAEWGCLKSCASKLNWPNPEWWESVLEGQICSKLLVHGPLMSFGLGDFRGRYWTKSGETPEMRDLNDTCLALKFYNLYVHYAMLHERNGLRMKGSMKLPNSSNNHGNNILLTLKTSLSATNSWFAWMFRKLSSWPRHDLVPLDKQTPSPATGACLSHGR